MNKLHWLVTQRGNMDSFSSAVFKRRILTVQGWRFDDMPFAYSINKYLCSPVWRIHYDLRTVFLAMPRSELIPFLKPKETFN